MCKWCEELNAEPNEIRVTEIYISHAGHYQYGIPMIYCPNCGAKLKRYGEPPKEKEQ